MSSAFAEVAATLAMRGLYSLSPLVEGGSTGCNGGMIAGDACRGVQQSHASSKLGCICKDVRSGKTDSLQQFLLESPTQEDLSSLLCVAAGFGHAECVSTLLECAASQNTSASLCDSGQRPQTQRNALHEACLWDGGQKVLGLLLKHQVDPSITAKMQGKLITAPEMAVLKGHDRLAQIIGASRPTSRKAERASPTWRPSILLTLHPV